MKLFRLALGCMALLLALAEELDVARATIVEAYEQLLGEGYLETRSGSGTRIAAELPEVLLASTPQRTVKPAPVRLSARREPARPFRSGLVDWEAFPQDDWGRLLGRVWRNPPVTLLEHTDPFGWLPLREAIARHLYEWRHFLPGPAGDRHRRRTRRLRSHCQGGDEGGR